MKAKACVGCAKRKVRCHGRNSCLPCERRKQDCTYSVNSRNTRLKRLEVLVRDLGADPELPGLIPNRGTAAGTEQSSPSRVVAPTTRSRAEPVMIKENGETLYLES